MLGYSAASAFDRAFIRLSGGAQAHADDAETKRIFHESSDAKNTMVNIVSKLCVDDIHRVSVYLENYDD